MSNEWKYTSLDHGPKFYVRRQQLIFIELQGLYRLLGTLGWSETKIIQLQTYLQQQRIPEIGSELLADFRRLTNSQDSTFIGIRTLVDLLKSSSIVLPKDVGGLHYWSNWDDEKMLSQSQLSKQVVQQYSSPSSHRQPPQRPRTAETKAESYSQPAPQRRRIDEIKSARLPPPSRVALYRSRDWTHIAIHTLPEWPSGGGSGSDTEWMIKIPIHDISLQPEAQPGARLHFPIFEDPLHTWRIQVTKTTDQKQPFVFHYIELNAKDAGTSVNSQFEADVLSFENSGEGDVLLSDVLLPLDYLGVRFLLRILIKDDGFVSADWSDRITVS
jgi:hypothetical protein